MSFEDAVQRADKTRFISTVSLSFDRQFTVDWLRRMTAHRALRPAVGHRGTQWQRPSSSPDVDVVALLSPEPEIAAAQSASLPSRSGGADDRLEDVFQLVAGYFDALRLAFVVVDVLLVSYHVTRTCVSAHALWTVGFRERVMPPCLVDIDRCDVQHLRAGGGIPAVVVPADVGDDSTANVDDDATLRFIANSSVANHRDVVSPSSTLPNHSVSDACQQRRSPDTMCNAADGRTSPTFKAEYRLFHSHHHR